MAEALQDPWLMKDKATYPPLPSAGFRGSRGRGEWRREEGPCFGCNNTPWETEARAVWAESGNLISQLSRHQGSEAAGSPGSDGVPRSSQPNNREGPLVLGWQLASIVTVLCL